MMRNFIKVAAGTLTSYAVLALTNVVVFAQRYDYDYSISSSDPEAAGAVFGTTLLIICCAAIFALVFAGVISYLVHKDATKNNVDNPMLWTVLTFFSSFTGMLWVVVLLVYFLAIRPEAMKKNSGGNSTN